MKKKQKKMQTNSLVMTRMRHDLGKSPEEMAARLKRRRITGAPEEAESCPIARYCVDVLGAKSVEVGQSHIQIVFQVSLPSSFQQFIKNFDAGQYPGLIDKELRSFYRD